MIAGFVILLREGIEASMVVAILLAYLRRSGQRDHFAGVLAGVGAAIVLSAAAGAVIFVTLPAYGGTRLQAAFETVTYLVAAAILTYMTFWMSTHARGLSGDLAARAGEALSGRRRSGLFVLAFTTVGREALEATVFMLALAFATRSRGALLWGALLGFLASMGVAYVVYHLGQRLNIKRMFQVMGAALMVFAAALLADAVQNLQQLGWLPVLEERLWDTSRFLDQSSTLGGLVHTFFGYSATPTVLQVAVYAAYLAVVVPAFLGARPLAAWRRLTG
ncbi:MAG: FTR1 family iron permease [Acidimicrobiales bacterium]